MSDVRIEFVEEVNEINLSDLRIWYTVCRQGWRSVFVIGGAKIFFLKFLSQHWGGEMILYPSKTYSRPGGGAVTEFRPPKSTFSLSSSVSFKLWSAALCALHYWGGEIFQFQQPFSIIGGAKGYLRPPSIYIGGAIAPFAPPESQSLISWIDVRRWNAKGSVG